jgi:hypothetical protein
MNEDNGAIWLVNRAASASDQKRAISLRNPRQRPKEDREWRRTCLQAGVALGPLVLVAAKVFTDYF